MLTSIVMSSVASVNAAEQRTPGKFPAFALPPTGKRVRLARKCQVLLCSSDIHVVVTRISEAKSSRHLQTSLLEVVGGGNINGGSGNHGRGGGDGPEYRVGLHVSPVEKMTAGSTVGKRIFITGATGCHVMGKHQMPEALKALAGFRSGTWGPVRFQYPPNSGGPLEYDQLDIAGRRKEVTYGSKTGEESAMKDAVGLLMRGMLTGDWRGLDSDLTTTVESAAVAGEEEKENEMLLLMIRGLTVVESPPAHACAGGGDTAAAEAAASSPLEVTFELAEKGLGMTLSLCVQGLSFQDVHLHGQVAHNTVMSPSGRPTTATRGQVRVLEEGSLILRMMYAQNLVVSTIMLDKDSSVAGRGRIVMTRNQVVEGAAYTQCRLLVSSESAGAAERWDLGAACRLLHRLHRKSRPNDILSLLSSPPSDTFSTTPPTAGSGGASGVASPDPYSDED